jgi:hypothetical protein
MGVSSVSGVVVAVGTCTSPSVGVVVAEPLAGVAVAARVAVCVADATSVGVCVLVLAGWVGVVTSSGALVPVGVGVLVARYGNVAVVVGLSGAGRAAVAVSVGVSVGVSVAVRVGVRVGASTVKGARL